MNAAYQLTRPFAFLRVREASLDTYRWIIPLSVSFISGVGYVALPVRIDLFGDGSASDYLIMFFAALPGFYIAALAAVATFQGRDLDRELNDGSITIPMIIGGERDYVSLTLRTFLSHLFAYLTAICFIGFFAAVLASVLAPNILVIAEEAGLKLDSPLMRMAPALYTAALAFIAASIAACTAHGLYFLAERVHQEID